MSLTLDLGDFHVAGASRNVDWTDEQKICFQIQLS